MKCDLLFLCSRNSQCPCTAELHYQGEQDTRRFFFILEFLEGVLTEQCKVQAQSTYWIPEISTEQFIAKQDFGASDLLCFMVQFEALQMVIRLPSGFQPASSALRCGPIASFSAAMHLHKPACST